MEHCEQYYSNKLDNLNKMEQFLEINKLLKTDSNRKRKSEYTHNKPIN